MRTFALAALTLLLACAPKKNTPINEIPQLKTLDDVMDNQSTTFDPVFKKAGKLSLSDADFAQLGEAGVRLQATSIKARDFAAGRAEFDSYAGQLNDGSKALVAAATAKDAAAATAALTAMKAACKGCHSKFR
jgi:hypothetical protein